jgi:hypothetical protein
MTNGRVGFLAIMLLTSLCCGSGGAHPAAPPRCLVDLIATCPLAGVCQSSGEAGADQRFCFAGGTTVSVASIADGTPPQSGTNTEVRRSDGTLCYSIEMRCGTFCESNYYTWKDAAGAVVAHGLNSGISSSNTISTTATCDATGETCNAHTPAIEPTECITLAVTSPAGLGCTPGSCP